MSCIYQKFAYLYIIKQIEIMETQVNQINEVLKANGVTSIFVKKGKRAVQWFGSYGNTNSGYLTGKGAALQSIDCQSNKAYIAVATILNYDPFGRLANV